MHTNSESNNDNNKGRDLHNKPDFKNKDVHIKDAQFDQSVKKDITQLNPEDKYPVKEGCHKAKADTNTCDLGDDKAVEGTHKRPVADNISHDKPKEAKHEVDPNDLADKHTLNNAGKKNDTPNNVVQGEATKNELKAATFPKKEEKVDINQSK